MKLARDRHPTHTAVGAAMIHANARGRIIPMKKNKYTSRQFRRRLAVQRWASWILAALLFLIALAILLAVATSCASQPIFVDSIKP